MEKTPDSMLEKMKNAGSLTLLPVYMLNLILPQLNRKVPTSPNEKRNQAFRNTIWIPQSIQQLLSLRVTVELMDTGLTVLRLSREMGARIWPRKDNFTMVVHWEMYGNVPLRWVIGFILSDWRMKSKAISLVLGPKHHIFIEQLLQCVYLIIISSIDFFNWFMITMFRLYSSFCFILTDSFSMQFIVMLVITSIVWNFHHTNKQCINCSLDSKYKVSLGQTLQVSYYCTR